MTAAKRVIHSDPDILGGIPVFVRTRVPMKTLLDYLEAGDSLDEFLDHFPSVSRDQAIAAAIYNNHGELWRKANDVAGIAKPSIAVAD